LVVAKLNIVLKSMAKWVARQFDSASLSSQISFLGGITALLFGRLIGFAHVSFA
jgi:hypothetical protein